MSLEVLPLLKKDRLLEDLAWGVRVEGPRLVVVVVVDSAAPPRAPSSLGLARGLETRSGFLRAPPLPCRGVDVASIAAAPAVAAALGAMEKTAALLVL